MSKKQNMKRRWCRVKAQRRIWKMWEDLDNKAWKEAAPHLYMWCGGLWGMCFSVSVNGWSKTMDKEKPLLQRRVRQAMRIAKFARERGMSYRKW